MSSPSFADQITLGNSPPNVWDIAGTGNSHPLAVSGGPFTTPVLFGGDVGTASFGPIALATTNGANGVFPIISQTQPGESLSIVFNDGDTITGIIDWANLNNGSLNPHVDGTYSYSTLGDPSFVAAFGPSGSTPIDIIFEQTAQTLENWNTDAAATFSSGEIPGGTSVSEPGNMPTIMALVGGILVAVHFGRRPKTSS